MPPIPSSPESALQRGVHLRAMTSCDLTTHYYYFFKGSPENMLINFLEQEEVGKGEKETREKH